MQTTHQWALCKRAKKQKPKPTVSSTLLLLVKCLVIAFVLEVTLFNCNFYLSLGNQPVEIAQPQIELTGLERQTEACW